MERVEIENALRVAKRQHLTHGYLYTLNGDSPGIAETFDEVGEGRIILGEIGKTSIEEMATRLTLLRK